MTVSPLSAEFRSTEQSSRRRRNHPPPFSIRFTDEERARLDRDAGVLSLAAYIRLKLFADTESPPPKRKRLSRKQRSPSAELAMISHMLGGLGQSRLSSNMNQLAKAASVGALPVTPELEAELAEACAEIKAMREALISALGVKAQ